MQDAAAAKARALQTGQQAMNQLEGTITRRALLSMGNMAELTAIVRNALCHTLFIFIHHARCARRIGVFTFVRDFMRVFPVFRTPIVHPNQWLASVNKQ